MSGVSALPGIPGLSFKSAFLPLTVTLSRDLHRDGTKEWKEERESGENGVVMTELGQYARSVVITTCLGARNCSTDCMLIVIIATVQRCKTAADCKLIAVLMNTKPEHQVV